MNGRIVAGGATLAACAVALAGCGGSRHTSSTPVTYRAKDTQGAAVSTAALRGKAVLLTSWATWCTACRAQLPSLETYYEHHRDRLAMVAVNVNTDGLSYLARREASQLGLTMPLWSDPDNNYTAQFRGIGVPTAVLLDTRGRVVHVWQGGADVHDATTLHTIEAAGKGAA